ncbi:MAG: hypothetical protein K8S25_05985 [Alphaproteobacteria bacterium]|nr:hypothetical protein [Alphaproteobacteria bacterium]
MTKKPRKPTDSHKPVTKVVQSILEQARSARSDGPFSGLYSRDAQLSGAMTQAGTFLAALDKAGVPKKASALQQLVGSLKAAPAPRRRSWFFAAPASPMPDAKQIEKLLQAATKGGQPLVLDAAATGGTATANHEIECHLPPDAVDPVCEPR